MPFGDPDATTATLLSSNAHVQLALLAMRPYGATPLAGMLEDARDFIYSDVSIDPTTTKTFGPAGDDYFKGGCRKTYVIVLSDGEPNLDLRKEGCATGNGVCPYDEPHAVAADMANWGNAKMRVNTFAIGFGLSKAAGVDCSTLDKDDFNAGGVCESASGALAACCTLARIADEGGTGNAFFADDEVGLKSALSQVLGQITSGSKTRTIPAFGTTSASSAALGNADAVGYRFGAQFDTPSNSPLWVGRLVRERYKCVSQSGGSQKSEPQAVDAGKGDNFARNVSSNDASNPRKFLTVIGEDAGGLVHSVRSIRPKLAALGINDGMGLYSGVPTNSGAPQIGSAFATSVAAAPQAFGIDPASPPNTCTTQLGTNSATTCAQLLVRWEIGEVDAGLPTRDISGCQVIDPISGQPMGCELGSIYHSTPVVIGPPNEFLRDESYDQFALAQAGRPTMLYVSTTDGQLHAFKVAANKTSDSLKVDTLQNNELWSFLPPAVLPRLLTTYNQQSILLDGQVVVEDVVLERTAAQAIAGGGAGGPEWRTILLSGGGIGGGYYFALDVTDPTQPVFLWQLSQDSQGLDMFGSQVPTPAIARITVGDNGTTPKDVAVAILPGGSDALQAGACDRVALPPYPQIDGGNPRSATRCWASGAGRSLTIARLDTGEVIRTFVSPKATISSNLLGSRKTVAPFDSPLVGTPVPYPAKDGQISTRVYVGDADGTLWRVDLSKPDPDDWKVEMMWDGYDAEPPESGHPIQTPPVVSIDNFGQPVLLFSTGDQESITSTTPRTYLWSITEKVNGASFQAKANYHLDLIGGERVTGPISLFSGTAYFSSFAPQELAATGDACTYGEGKLWGIDYLTGEGRLDPLDTTIKSQSFGPNSIVFGVAVTQTPSCSDGVATYASPYFGTGPQIDIPSTAGEFQLAYQVSGQQGAQQPNNGSGVINTKTLPAPRVTTRIDSWAAVVE
jgi:type IV pilus assembly protein PilY1